jgi:L-threonylcarbamoyladenylate synthase
MKIIKHDEFFKDKELRKWIVNSIKGGSIVIYPTDTIYGIGCDMGNDKSVKKIQEAKDRANPFSVVAPSISWMEKHLVIPDGSKAMIKKSLPGPFTFILKAKNNSLPKAAVSSNNTVGVRIPKNYFTDVIRKENILLVTTSVNIHGESPAKNLNEIPKKLSEIADIAIDAGELNNPPSTIIDLTSKKPNIMKR